MTAEATTGETVVVNPHLQVVLAGDNEVLIRHGTRSPHSEIIRDEANTRLIGRILRGAGAPTSVARLREQGVLTDGDTEQAAAVVEHLLAKGILTRAHQDPVRVYLDTIFGGSGNGSSGRQPGNSLDGAVLGLVGCGQLGAAIAGQLAALRPRGALLFDPRPVDPVAARYAGYDGGEGSLAQALHGRLRGNGRDALENVDVVEATGITDDKALARVFEESTFVVVAAEAYAPGLLHAANDHAVTNRRPWMSVYFDGSEALVGPTFVPGQTACYHEFELQCEASLSYRGSHLIFKEELEERGLAPDAIVLPPYALTAAGMAATSALHFLVGGSSFTVGRSVRLNFETLGVDYQDVFRLPRCPACSPDRSPYRHLFL